MAVFITVESNYEKKNFHLKVREKNSFFSDLYIMAHVSLFLEKQDYLYPH